MAREPHGVLGWLLAGADALSSCNTDDRALIAAALESLPDGLDDEARQRAIEGKVHRWAGAVSGQPGGCPLRDVSSSPSTGTGRASGTGRGWRLPVRFDAERRASFGAHLRPPCCAADASAAPASASSSLGCSLPLELEGPAVAAP